MRRSHHPLWVLFGCWHMQLFLGNVTCRNVMGNKFKNQITYFPVKASPVVPRLTAAIVLLVNNNSLLTWMWEIRNYCEGGRRRREKLEKIIHTFGDGQYALAASPILWPLSWSPTLISVNPQMLNSDAINSSTRGRCSLLLWELTPVEHIGGIKW